MKEHSAAIHVQVPVDVATFLLNEKRTDIHRIESRLRVSVTLIPNPHMETPHYSVTRLRHDDLTGENLQASYKLVEKPEETKAVAISAQEAKAQRPQAAVQGITPAQPAPMRPVEKKEEQQSFFSKLFGWFKPKEEEQPVAQAAPAKQRSGQPRREREGGRPEGGKQEGRRRERPEGGQKPRREREEAAPRTEKPARPEAQRSAAPKPQEPRGERPPRPPRPAEPALEAAPQITAATPEQAEEGGAREGGRRRGRRGGQRERARREQQTTEKAAGSEPAGNAEIAPQSVAATQPSPQVMEQASLPIAQPASPSIVERAAAVAAAHPAPVAEPAPAAEAAPVAQPAAAERVVALPVEQAIAPVQASIPGTISDLVQIETDPSKRAAASAPQAEATAPAPRRRSRPREVYSMENSEPLVQIETHSPANR